MATGTAVEVSGEVSGDYGGNGFFTRSNVATEANGVATKITQDAKPFDWPPKAARAKRRSRKQATRETPRWLVSRLRRFARGERLSVRPPLLRCSVLIRCLRLLRSLHEQVLPRSGRLRLPRRRGRRDDRRRQRPVAVKRRPVRYRQFRWRIEHRRVDRPDLRLVDHEPLAERVSRRRRSGTPDENRVRQRDLRLLVDQGSPPRHDH